MAMVFYPNTEDTLKGSFEERIELLMEAAERYKAAVLDVSGKVDVPLTPPPANGTVKRAVPRDLAHAYNWEAIAVLLREVRDLPEGNKVDKDHKGALLSKLAEVYEVLRGAKMSKLEAVRLALINESNQLGGGATPQVG